MDEDRVTIDRATVADNPGDRQVEFDGEASGEVYPFALRYEVLEALSGQQVLDNPVALFGQHADRIERIAAEALARNSDVERVIVSGNDLD